MTPGITGWLPGPETMDRSVRLANTGGPEAGTWQKIQVVFGGTCRAALTGSRSKYGLGKEGGRAKVPLEKPIGSGRGQWLV